MNKITVQAPANIAFVKYWGRRDHKQYLPANDNISMTMSGCQTTTTVELIDSKEDEIFVKFYQQDYQKISNDSRKTKALFNQIERIRELANSQQRVKIYSENNFPADAGIASSASSFCALTAALLLAYGLKEMFADKTELSRQIRLCGSGSAVRSALGGFVQWTAGTDNESSIAIQIADEKSWDLVDIVAVVDTEKKKISSSLGHELANTSPFFESRVNEVSRYVSECRKAILQKDIKTLGEIIEKDAISMHAVMMTSTPSAFYLAPGSMSIIHALHYWREHDNLAAYFTFDAGANAHIICEKKDAQEVTARLKTIPFVKWTIYNEPCPGVHIIDTHLF